MWHGGNKRCGAESNKTVCAYKDIPWSHLDGETLKKTRREGACGAKLWGTSRRSSTRPPAPHTRCGAATHHRTIMMLVTLIPKGSSGTRTSQPSMNTVATVDKNLRLALKAAKAAAAARQQGWCLFEETASEKKRATWSSHTITHTHKVSFSRS